jgi:hypothetical protein
MFDHDLDRHVRDSVVITTMVRSLRALSRRLPRRHLSKQWDDANIMVRGYVGVRHMAAGESGTGVQPRNCSPPRSQRKPSKWIAIRTHGHFSKL